MESTLTQRFSGPRVFKSPMRSADDRQYYAADIAGCHRRSHKHVGRGQLFRLHGPFHVAIPAELRNVLGGLVRRIQWRPYRPRCHAVHADSKGKQLRRQRLGKCVDGALCRGIVDQRRAAEDTGLRTGIVDARPLRQMRKHCSPRRPSTRSPRAPRRIAGPDSHPGQLRRRSGRVCDWAGWRGGCERSRLHCQEPSRTAGAVGTPFPASAADVVNGTVSTPGPDRPRSRAP